MKAVIGMTLIGGGVILMVGLFTGKIHFPGSGGTTLSSNDQNTIKKNAGGISPVGGKCPSGYQMMGGVCMPNSVLGQI